MVDRKWVNVIGINAAALFMKFPTCDHTHKPKSWNLQSELSQILVLTLYIVWFILRDLSHISSHPLIYIRSYPVRPYPLNFGLCVDPSLYVLYASSKGSEEYCAG